MSENTEYDKYALTSEIFLQQEKRNFASPRSLVISSIYFRVKKEDNSRLNGTLLFQCVSLVSQHGGFYHVTDQLQM